MEITEKNIDNLSSAEISNLIAEKEQELMQAIKNQEVVENEEYMLAKAILELRIKKKDIDVACSKARAVVRRLNIELRILRNKFWSVKNSGL